MSRNDPKRVAWAIDALTGTTESIAAKRTEDFWLLPLRAVELAEGLVAKADPPHPQAAALREAFAVVRAAPAMEALRADNSGAAREMAMQMLAVIAVLVDGPTGVTFHEAP